MNSVVLATLGGTAAGIVHVLSGPDHLAAVLPFAVRDRTRAVKTGALWGAGHGLGVAAIALLFTAVRGSIDIEAVSHWAEVFVGVLLVILGLWSLRQSRLLVVHSHPHRHGADTHDHPHVHVGDRTVSAAHHENAGRHGRHPHSVFGFGVVHGLAGTSHLLGILPSFALETTEALCYLAAFLIGGTAAMTAFALAAGRLVQREAWRPRGLALAGAASIGVGLFWLIAASVA